MMTGLLSIAPLNGVVVEADLLEGTFKLLQRGGRQHFNQAWNRRGKGALEVCGSDALNSAEKEESL